MPRNLCAEETVHVILIIVIRAILIKSSWRTRGRGQYIYTRSHPFAGRRGITTKVAFPPPRNDIRVEINSTQQEIQRDDQP